MNEAHWHLALNHFPVFATCIGVILLLGGILLRKKDIKASALVVFILASLVAVPAYLTGEGAEDILESIGQKNEHFIHEHEEAAGYAFWLCMADGILSLFLLIMMKKKNFNNLFGILLILGTINSVMMLRVANSGGMVRHTEVRGTTND